MTSPSIRVEPYRDGQGGMIEAHVGSTVQGWLYFALLADGSVGIDMVEVEPEYRERGVASMMLAHLIEMHPGVSTYRANTANEASQRLFDAMAEKRPDLTIRAS
jgi:ribosomal protein S18 acetylase RimI-like enzyme